MTGSDHYLTQKKSKDMLRDAEHALTLSQGFGYGIRPFTSGGIGVLLDVSGNDFYGFRNKVR
jgi:hypothetical protein